MKRIKHFLVAVSYLFLFMVSGTPAQTFNPEKKFTINKLQEDFIILRKLIEDNHPALYRYYDEEFFKNYFDSIQTKINHEMTELEFIKILDPMVAKVHCGHTELWYSENFREYIYRHGLFIPFSIYYIKDKAYVRKDYTENKVLPEGAEITLINDTPVSLILKSLYKSMNGDGFNTQNILFTINNSPVSTLSKYFNYIDNYNIQFKEPDNMKVSTLLLKAIKYQDLVSIANKRYHQGSEDSEFNLKILDSIKTAVITIQSFVKKKNDNYFNFLKSSFDQIDSFDIQNLIIDVRGNDGGDPDYAIEVLKYIMDMDFIYFKTKLNSQEWNNPIKPYANSFKGNIFILINGGELSTTGHFISLVKYHNIGKFIGQESGSTYSCHDNSLEFVLPNTGIGGKVARTTFETAVTDISWENGIQPDYYVEPNIIDVLKNKDTIMEYTLQLISSIKMN